MCTDSHVLVFKGKNVNKFYFSCERMLFIRMTFNSFIFEKLIKWPVEEFIWVLIGLTRGNRCRKCKILTKNKEFSSSGYSMGFDSVYRCAWTYRLVVSIAASQSTWPGFEPHIVHYIYFFPFFLMKFIFKITISLSFQQYIIVPYKFYKFHPNLPFSSI